MDLLKKENVQIVESASDWKDAIRIAVLPLEQDGYVYRRKDEGTFVAKENRVNEMRRRELMQKFDLVVRELSELSVSSNELAERVEVITKGDKTF